MIVKYHKDVYLPPELERKALTILVRYNGRYRLTEHAVRRVIQKRVRLPKRIPFHDVGVVEVTTYDGKVQKFLLRFDHGDGVNDVCLSYAREGNVCTVWLNQKDDHHETLKRRAYEMV